MTPINGDRVLLKTHTQEAPLVGAIEHVDRIKACVAFEGGRQDNTPLTEFFDRYTWDEDWHQWRGHDAPPPPAHEG